MNGPHAMHNVNDPRFIDEKHGDLYEHNHAACQVCQGTNLQGSALSRAATSRQLKQKNGWANVAKGQMIS